MLSHALTKHNKTKIKKLIFQFYKLNLPSAGLQTRLLRDLCCTQPQLQS
jgi:hypothetical protein